MKYCFVDRPFREPGTLLLTLPPCFLIIRETSTWEQHLFRNFWYQWEPVRMNVIPANICSSCLWVWTFSQAMSWVVTAKLCILSCLFWGSLNQPFVLQPSSYRQPSCLLIVTAAIFCLIYNWNPLKNLNYGTGTQCHSTCGTTYDKTMPSVIRLDSYHHAWWYDCYKNNCDHNSYARNLLFEFCWWKQVGFPWSKRIVNKFDHVWSQFAVRIMHTEKLEKAFCMGFLLIFCSGEYPHRKGWISVDEMISGLETLGSCSDLGLISGLKTLGSCSDLDILSMKWNFPGSLSLFATQTFHLEVATMHRHAYWNLFWLFFVCWIHYQEDVGTVFSCQMVAEKWCRMQHFCSMKQVQTFQLFIEMYFEIATSPTSQIHVGFKIMYPVSAFKITT